MAIDITQQTIQGIFTEYLICARYSAGDVTPAHASRGPESYMHPRGKAGG